MRRLIGGALAALAIVMITPTAAYAFGEWREEGMSTFDLQAEKSAEASCPDGSMVVGSGGYVLGGEGKVVLTGVVPNVGLDTVTAYAKALPYNLAPWAVVALAVCGDRDESVHREMGISFFGNARAQCPQGKVLWSTGFNVPWSTLTTTYVSAVEPALDQTSVLVRGVSAPGAAVIAYGICGYDFFSGTEVTSAATAVVPRGQTYLKVDPAFHGGRVFGAGISANRSGLFVDGLGMGIDFSLPEAGWASGRMSWLPGSGGSKAPAARTATGDEVTVYALTIGSWYD
ncbi:hypothetical protein [Rhizocola hellebori]|nr:hypothetical protein [Rhizocola hellebori]